MTLIFKHLWTYRKTSKCAAFKRVHKPHVCSVPTWKRMFLSSSLMLLHMFKCIVRIRTHYVDSPVHFIPLPLHPISSHFWQSSFKSFWLFLRSELPLLFQGSAGFDWGARLKGTDRSAADGFSLRVCLTPLKRQMTRRGWKRRDLRLIWQVAVWGNAAFWWKSQRFVVSRSCRAAGWSLR